MRGAYYNGAMRRLLVVISFVLCAAADAPTVKPLPLPDGKAGIGFDDLRFDAATDRLLIPAGRTGNVDVIDPKTLAITPIAGFSKLAKYDRGHGQSVTSIDAGDAGDNLLFATDRTALKLSVVDRKTNRVVAQAPLASAPDYVRFVPSPREVWVTEPGKKRIEVFALDGTTPRHAAFIDTPGGPESLVVDGKRGRAFTHRWKESTLAIDLKSRAVVATWSAGCADPRGIALDERRGFLLVGCEDGTATALDVDHGGKLLSTVKSGAGVDIIAYDAARGRFYLPGDESATMAVIAVSDAGKLTVLGTVPTVKDAHCVTTDGHGVAYVCDPQHGQLLVVKDTF